MSKIIADQSTQMIKSLQEGLGGIRDVLIDGAQHFYCKLYRNADLPLRRAAGDNAFIGGSPRYAMEAIGMTLIAGLAYVMTQQESGVAAAIPMLGALALGMIIGYGVAVTNILSGKSELRSLRAKNRRLSDELNDLRNVAIDEGIYDSEDGVD